jgi:hypothetical protein
MHIGVKLIANQLRIGAFQNSDHAIQNQLPMPPVDRRASPNLRPGWKQKDIGQRHAVDRRYKGYCYTVTHLRDVGQFFITWIKPNTAPMIPMVGE